jgi:hypothetical protein
MNKPQWFIVVDSRGRVRWMHVEDRAACYGLFLLSSGEERSIFRTDSGYVSLEWET